ncbi:hypothetical protein DEO72_LG3g707 [Vigna unguiculata]|uniref:Uncharacterized protein n=1 Tax=Vigna unguiculata TaxID=3917 RepID=A0A4D6LCS0_VIGUN|nr:hypothetical protein DEO72_LG3g707 [Vigna unguiculata]
MPLFHFRALLGLAVNPLQVNSNQTSTSRKSVPTHTLFPLSSFFVVPTRPRRGTSPLGEGLSRSSEKGSPKRAMQEPPNVHVAISLKREFTA